MDGWTLLLMAVCLNQGAAWRPEFSDRLDRLITDERRLRARESDRVIRARLVDDSRRTSARTIEGPDAPPRGELSPEEVARRRAVDAHMRGQSPSHNWPVPRPLPNGKWSARVIHKGKHYQRTCTSREEAEDFIRQVKTDNYKEEACC